MTTITKEAERFANALKAKNYSPRTIEQYCSIIKKFLRHFKTSPNRINSEQIAA